MRAILAILMFLFVSVASAQSTNSVSPLWESSKFCKRTAFSMMLKSYHVHRSDNNEDNFGLGAECYRSEDFAWIGGFYKNSQYEQSIYYGASYTPWHLSSRIKAGVAFGGITGYSTVDACSSHYGVKLFGECHNAALTGVVTYQQKHYGLNLMFAPIDGGVIGLQVKYIF